MKLSTKTGCYYFLLTVIIPTPNKVHINMKIEYTLVVNVTAEVMADGHAMIFKEPLRDVIN